MGLWARILSRRCFGTSLKLRYRSEMCQGGSARDIKPVSLRTDLGVWLFERVKDHKRPPLAETDEVYLPPSKKAAIHSNVLSEL